MKTQENGWTFHLKISRIKSWFCYDLGAAENLIVQVIEQASLSNIPVRVGIVFWRGCQCPHKSYSDTCAWMHLLIWCTANKFSKCVFN